MIYDSGSAKKNIFVALHDLMHVLSLQHQDLNAQQIRNVLIILHVLKRNAKILASQARVE